MDIQKIITVLDKPKHDQVAWRRTLALQKASGAAAEVVSFAWNVMCESSSGLSADERRQLRHSLVQARKTWLQDLVAGHEVRSRVIWTQDIARWVIEEAAKQQPDLVVKTVHKSGSVVHTPIDWQLLQDCPAPVLLTTKGRKRTNGVVLASIDPRATDTRHRHLNCNVLEAAHRFAALHNAEVHVVFAVELSKVLLDLDVVDERASKKKVVDKVTPELNRLLAPYKMPRARIHMPVGKAGAVVAQTARQLKADTLVVGTYAQRARRAVGLGNTAQRIVTRSVCDVLAVHP
ncbi:MAG: universal stress protein [bacterium]